VRLRRLAPLAAALLALACASPPKPGPPVRAGSFYWEATAPGGGVLYLLGSVHIGDGRKLELDPRVEAAWQRSEALVVEVDTRALSPLDALEITNRYGLYPQEQNLQDSVSPATYERLREMLKGRGLSMQAADRMRPWLLSQWLAQQAYQAAGYDPGNGVDAWFLKRASAERRAGSSGRLPVFQLESADEQMALFASLPDPLQEKMLVEMMDHDDELVSATREILGAWERGDEAALDRMLFATSGDADLEAFERRMYSERNQRMSDRLALLAADGRARFVVVGVGHLIGDESLPTLLAQQGFSVKRVADARVRAPGAMPLPKPPEPAPIPPPAAPPPKPPEVPRPAPP
jgi:uncharacterized protein YbaP (TraB family)